MQYDEIINCPLTGGDLCYKIEINEEITQYLSLSCGFWTNTLMTPGTDFYNEQFEILPEIYKDLAQTDTNTGLVWLPNTVNIAELGMVFAEGKSADEWAWSAVLAVKLNEEEKKEHKMDFKTDMASIKRFGPLDYIEALDYIGALPQNPEA
jgi:hypothetical protein|tara:strand:+ start:4109 stop:4561 length:453 start_codon:yes stop_codon:yes gene_type:complete